MTLLNHELLNVFDGKAQLRNAAVKPFFGSVSAFSIDFWDNLLDLIVELLWRGLQPVFDCFRVELKKTDVSARW